MFKLQKSLPWKLKSPPKCRKSQDHSHNAQNRRLGGDFTHVEDH